MTAHYKIATDNFVLTNTVDEITSTVTDIEKKLEDTEYQIHQNYHEFRSKASETDFEIEKLQNDIDSLFEDVFKLKLKLRRLTYSHIACAVGLLCAGVSIILMLLH